MSQGIQIAIIAAGSATFGVIASQLTTHWVARLNRKHQNNIFLRGKYEEMMFHFSRSLLWVSEVNECKTRSQLSAYSTSLDSRNALSLCLLYFPELLIPINNYILSQTSYYNSIVTKYNESLSESAGTQAFVHESHKTIMGQLLKQKETFEQEAMSHAKKYVEAPFL